MGLFGLIRTSRQSLGVLEASIQTVGHNIANAGTAGYSRQRLGLRAESLVTSGLHIGPPAGPFTGAGVSVQSYERVRDGLLDAAARDARSDLGAADEEVRLGSTIEGLFAVGTDGSLQASLTAFWDAWSDAADNPTDPGVRGVLQQRTDALAATFHRHDADLTRAEDDARTLLEGGVAEFNGLVEEVAALNEAVRLGQAAGTPDLAAEDARDQAVAALSELAPTRVAVEPDGTYTVTVQGMAVVQGSETLGVEHVGPPDAAADSVRFKGTDVELQPGEEGGGRFGGWLRTLNDDIPATRADLDALAAGLVEDVNAAHTAGFGLDGQTGLDFFDPAGTTAASIGRSSDIDDPAAIALAGAPDASGDATTALAIADLRAGFDDEASGIVAAVGSRLQQASASAAAADALVGHFDALAQGVSGVIIDEEMTRLIEYQQAYAASARVLDTAQELLDTLFAI